MAYTLEKTKTPVAAGIAIGTRADWVCHRDVSERSQTRGHAVSSQTRPCPKSPVISDARPMPDIGQHGGK